MRKTAEFEAQQAGMRASSSPSHQMTMMKAWLGISTA